MKIEKRFTKGDSILAIYTASRFSERVARPNPTDTEYETVLGIVTQLFRNMEIERCSGLLMQLNRTPLPAPIGIRGMRVGALVCSLLFFGFLAGMTLWQQSQRFP